MVMAAVAQRVDAGAGRRPLVADGVLNVRKERGWTSHDVVAKLRGLLRQPKIGHAGTLDPEATGVLPVLLGKATRIAEYLLAWDKEYRAVLRLGETTDTQDAAGKVIEIRPTEGLSAARIHDVLGRFRGRVLQTPPMYSAVKIGGRPLYKAARAGRTVEREAREVTIRELVCERIEGPEVWLRVACSKGTYVRTLCADIGEALGVGGHLRALERTRVGPFTIESAVTVEELAARLTRGEPAGEWLTLDGALAHLPAVTVASSGVERVTHGVPLTFAELDDAAVAVLRGVRAGEPVRVRDHAGRLLAIGRTPSAPSAAVALSKVFVGDGAAGSESESSEERKASAKG
jgi:tRNA pseudouridine55 synthase